MSLKDKIDLQKVPRHIAIIMDGNGRWAKKRNKERIFGHYEGVNSVRAIIKAAIEAGVKYLTLYAFSSENWQRPKEEVEALMDLLVKGVEEDLDKLNEQNVKLYVIGDIAGLPPKVKKSVDKALKATEKNTGLNLIIALNYGARQEILNAVKNIAIAVKNGKLDINAIDEKLFANYLTTKGIPDPDLLIRTSGEQRISNFLLWQISYTELYFTEILWPDFREEQFFEAIINYQNRERRFGKISEQLKK